MHSCQLSVIFEPSVALHGAGRQPRSIFQFRPTISPVGHDPNMDRVGPPWCIYNGTTRSSTPYRRPPDALFGMYRESRPPASRKGGMAAVGSTPCRHILPGRWRAAFTSASPRVPTSAPWLFVVVGAAFAECIKQGHSASCRSSQLYHLPSSHHILYPS